MTDICILGQHTQGLIASILLAKAGHMVTVVGFPDDTSYAEFHHGCKTGPVVHAPLALPSYLIDQLDLETHGFEIPSKPNNPFEKLPFYDGLQKIIEMMQSLDSDRPLYREKSWRDAWSTFEIGRVLSGYDDTIQSLFAKSATLSLNELLGATDLSDTEQAEIVAQCVLGSKTNPSDVGTAAAILPAMMPYIDDNMVLVDGALHGLSLALKQSAAANGVTMVDDQKIRKIVTEGRDIQSVILEDETEISAEYYILDIDPVRLFDEFLNDFSIPPAFKNRVYPTQNLKECVHIKMAVSGDFEIPNLIAPDVDYITQAKSDMKSDGGAQNPVLSIVEVTKNYPELGAGQKLLTIMAQYFEPNLDNDDAIIMAVTKVMTAHISGFHAGDVTHASVHPTPTQFGQPTFNTAMPLLQLFKVFSGHHAIAYDIPIDNAVVAGYGMGTANHYHTFDGGARVANLYQSL